MHCRTQEMRSSEPALHERMREITEIGQEKGIPVVCNGDVLGGGKDADWGNFQEVCEKTGASSPSPRPFLPLAHLFGPCRCLLRHDRPRRRIERLLLLLKGPCRPNQRGRPPPSQAGSSRPSLFPPALAHSFLPLPRTQGLATGNHYNNTKYLLNALYLYNSPTPPSREVNREYKQKMNKAKSYELMGAVFGMSEEEVQKVRDTRLEDLLPNWMERRRRIVEEEGEY